MPKIKDIPEVDRPREKLLKYGPEKLNNSELLGILIGSGTKDTNVVELSTKILKKFKTQNIKDLTVKELVKIKGLGKAKASRVVASMTLGKRLFNNSSQTVLRTPEDIWKACSDLWNKRKEYTKAFYLNAREEEIHRELIAVGTLNENLVHPREVFEPAVKRTAHSVVLVHNHPSGKTAPSRKDTQITERLQEAGEILGIKLYDHVIVTSEGFYSFKEKGLI